MADTDLHEKHDSRFERGKIYNALEMMGGMATCDNCGRWQRMPTLSESKLVEMAKEKGWTKVGEKDLCPICSTATA